MTSPANDPLRNYVLENMTRLGMDTSGVTQEMIDNLRRSLLGEKTTSAEGAGDASKTKGSLMSEMLQRLVAHKGD